MKLIWIFVILSAATLNYGTVTGTPLTKWFKTDNNTYYIEEQEKYSWQQSYEECQKKSMTLITLKAYKEDNLLLQYITQSFDPKPEFWLKTSDKVNLSDINKLLGSIMAADFLNIKLDGIHDPDVIQSNNPDNCILNGNGTVKACEEAHGFVCFRENKEKGGGQNIQNIVLKFN